MLWDFCKGNPLSSTTGNYSAGIDWVAESIDHIAKTAALNSESPHVLNRSALKDLDDRFDLVTTDPPYYDAIPYSDLMDFFYIWLRRILFDILPNFDKHFSDPLSPKWDDSAKDGELIDDANRHNGDAQKSKMEYENGMAKVFIQCNHSLLDNGRMVVVFANKKPDAWET